MLPQLGRPLRRLHADRENAVQLCGYRRTRVVHLDNADPEVSAAAVARRMVCQCHRDNDRTQPCHSVLHLRLQAQRHRRHQKHKKHPPTTKKRIGVNGSVSMGTATVTFNCSTPPTPANWGGDIWEYTVSPGRPPSIFP